MISKQFVLSVLRVAGLILFYYLTSIGITFYNQNFVRSFNFPLTLTLCHFIAKYIFASIIRTFLMWRGTTRLVHLGWKQCLIKILPTAVAGSLDIGLSNWSFEFVTISLYTMTKSSAILFILFFSIVFKIEKARWSTGALVLLIAGGLFLFTYRSSQFSAGGFILVLLASCLSGIRWSLTQLVMQKAEIGLSNPLDMMYHIQPFMAISILPLAVFNEGVEVALSPYFFAIELGDNETTVGLAFTLLFGGCILAFLLELAEFLLVRNTSSLTLAISGIFKELCTLLLASFFQNDVITPINWAGVALCISGISLHTYVKFNQGRNESKKPQSSFSPGEHEMSNLMPDEVDLSDEEHSPLVKPVTSSGAEQKENNCLLENDGDHVLFSASIESIRKNISRHFYDKITKIAVEMSGILPDTTVTSAFRYNNNTAALNGNNNNNNAAAFEKCNCDAYVTWINAQLCESYLANNGQVSLLHCQQQQRTTALLTQTSPNSVPVKDLSRDLRNGVVLARLAEKLSGEHLEKVHPHPVTRQQMLTNIDEVLKFALRWRVKMHPVLSTEIVDGDTRATLRLVLALAAHFRPGSVIRQIGGPSKAPTTPQRLVVFNNNNSSSSCCNNNNNNETYPHLSPTTISPTAITRQDPQQFFSSKLLRYKAVRSPRTAVSTSSGIFSSPIDSSSSNLNRPSSAQFEDENYDGSNSREDSQISSPLSHEAQAGSNGTTSICSLESSSKPMIIDEQEFSGLQTEMASAKKTLLVLQQMLCEQDGVSDHSITDSTPVNGSSGQQKAAINGHAHVVDNNTTVLQLRAQIREMNLTIEEMAVEKRQLECRLNDMQSSLSERDLLISHLQAKVRELIDSGRREVAELKELAVAAASPTSDNVFLSPFGATKKLLNGNHLNNDGGDNDGGKGSNNGFSGCRIYYFNSDGAGPFCLFATKPLESLCLRDIRQAFSRFGRKYRFRFIPLHELERKRALLGSSNVSAKPTVGLYNSGKLDPSLATLELRNDDDPLPGFENQIYCRLEESV